MSEALLQDTATRIEAAYRELYCTDGFIPLHQPCFGGREQEYAATCIKSGWVSSAGPYVEELQKKLAALSGARFAVPLSCGTAGLHLALLCCGVRPGDEVLCPDLSFVATAAAIVYCGADPVFLDVDEDTLSLSPDALEVFLKTHAQRKGKECWNRKTGKRIAACIVMHNVGFPARMAQLQEPCRAAGIPIVEDAAESLGSTLDGRMCGTFGRAGVYSFNGNKIVTSGGGGAVITDEERLYRRCLHLSTTAKKPHPWRYDHDAVGYNYRMPNLNAALALAQLEQLGGFLERKAAQHAFLKEKLAGVAMAVLGPPQGQPNHWFLIARLTGTPLPKLIAELARRKIMARPVWSRISRMKPYRQYLCADNRHAARIARSVLCLPNGIMAAAGNRPVPSGGK